MIPPALRADLERIAQFPDGTTLSTESAPQAARMALALAECVEALRGVLAALEHAGECYGNMDAMRDAIAAATLAMKEKP